MLRLKKSTQHFYLLIFIGMVKLQTLLTEVLENLYHATTVDKLLNILKDDAIKFTFTTDVERKVDGSGKNYMLCTSRSKYGGYALRQSKSVVIVLNGRAIENSRDVKIKSVDYFGYNYWKDSPENNETEERILSNLRDNFSPLKKYVKEILVMLHLRDNNHNKHDPTWIVQLIKNYYIPIAEFAKTSPIPIYFFSDAIDPKAGSYYKSHRTERGLNANEFLNHLNNILLSSDYNQIKTEPLYQRTHSFFTNKTVKQLGILIDLVDHPEKYNGVEYHTIDEDARYVIDYVMYYNRELENHFGADIHNLRWEHPVILKVLAASMHKHKCKTFKSYLEYLKSFNWQLVQDRENRTNVLRHNKTEIRQESTSTTDGDHPNTNQKYQSM